MENTPTTLNKRSWVNDTFTFPTIITNDIDLVVVTFKHKCETITVNGIINGSEISFPDCLFSHIGFYNYNMQITQSDGTVLTPIAGTVTVSYNL